MYANNATLKAGIAVREAEVGARAPSSRAPKATSPAGRACWPAARWAPRRSEAHRATIATARGAVAAAEAGVLAAREQLAANLVMTEETTVARHPNVRRAAVQVREAWLALARTSWARRHRPRRAPQRADRAARGRPVRR